MKNQRQTVGGSLVLLVAFALLLTAGPAGAVGNNDLMIKDPLELLEDLRKKRIESEERTKELDRREDEIKEMEKKLTKSLEELKELRDKISNDLARRKAKAEDEDIKKLAEIYSKMRAKAAAPRMAVMERSTAIKVFKAMKTRISAKILSKMAAPAAVQLSEDLVPLDERRGRRR